MADQSFSKSERITSKTAIDLLFSKSNNAFSFPLKAYFNTKNITKTSVQILITVPKRNFKKAVDRNRIKRLIRENYRKNKELITLKENLHTEIAFVYIHKEILTYQQIEKSVVLLLQKIEISTKNKVIA